MLHRLLEAARPYETVFPLPILPHGDVRTSVTHALIAIGQKSTGWMTMIDCMCTVSEDSEWIPCKVAERSARVCASRSRFSGQRSQSVDLPMPDVPGEAYDK